MMHCFLEGFVGHPLEPMLEQWREILPYYLDLMHKKLDQDNPTWENLAAQW